MSHPSSRSSREPLRVPRALYDAVVAAMATPTPPPAPAASLYELAWGADPAPVTAPVTALAAPRPAAAVAPVAAPAAPRLSVASLYELAWPGDAVTAEHIGRDADVYGGGR